MSDETSTSVVKKLAIVVFFQKLYYLYQFAYHIIELHFVKKESIDEKELIKLRNI